MCRSRLCARVCGSRIRRSGRRHLCRPSSRPVRLPSAPGTGCGTHALRLAQSPRCSPPEMLPVPRREAVRCVVEHGERGRTTSREGRGDIGRPPDGRRRNADSRGIGSGVIIHHGRRRPGVGSRQRQGTRSQERRADHGHHDDDDRGEAKPPASARDDAGSLPAALVLLFSPLPVVRSSDPPAGHSTPPGAAVRFRRWALHGCRRKHRRQVCEGR